MTLAAVARLVHHSVILEMNVESYRRRATESQVTRLFLAHELCGLTLAATYLNAPPVPNNRKNSRYSPCTRGNRKTDNGTVTAEMPP